MYACYNILKIYRRNCNTKYEKYYKLPSFYDSVPPDLAKKTGARQMHVPAFAILTEFKTYRMKYSLVFVQFYTIIHTNLQILFVSDI